MENFFTQNPILSIALLLVLIEQVVIYFKGSYPYRYGIVIQKMAMPGAESLLNNPQLRNIPSLAMMINTSRSEIYLRYRYLFGSLGPILFIGQITLENGGTARIRMGPISALFLLYVVLFLTISSTNPLVYSINIACIALIILFLYVRMQRSYQKLLNTIPASQLGHVGVRLNTELCSN